MQGALEGSGNPVARKGSISGCELPVNRLGSVRDDAPIRLFLRPMYFRVAAGLCVTWDATHD